MQFQVPQFIETEDKIVGPLSLKQFIYIGIAGGISLMLYFVMQFWIWILLSLPVLAAGIGFAVVRVGGRPLSAITRAAFFYFWKPQTYIWKPEQQEAENKEQGMKTEMGDTSLEKILAGIALQRTWQKLQTGSFRKISPRMFLHNAESFSLFRKSSGELHAARRVDYR